MTILHLTSIQDNAWPMCESRSKDDWQILASVYPDGTTASSFSKKVDHEGTPVIFTGYCEECLNSSEMVMYLLGRDYD